MGKRKGKATPVQAHRTGQTLRIPRIEILVKATRTSSVNVINI